MSPSGEVGRQGEARSPEAEYRLRLMEQRRKRIAELEAQLAQVGRELEREKRIRGCMEEALHDLKEGAGSPAGWVRARANRGLRQGETECERAAREA